MGRLEDKSVVVTGAARGLGEAYASTLAAEGARLVVNDIDDTLCLELVGRLKASGAQVVAHNGDVTSWDFADSLIQRCVDEFGRIDGLVNNAGTLVMKPVEEQDEDSFRDQLGANLFGTAFCGIHALRRMLRQNSGSIVNTLSGAMVGAPFRCAYSAATGGVSGLTGSWANEAAGSGVRVNAIAPIAFTREFDYTAPILRRLVDAGRYPQAALDHVNAQRKITAESNAPMVVYLLSDASTEISGQTLRLDDGRFMMLTRPLAIAPVLSEDDWTFEKIAAAFAGAWKDRLAPSGISEAEPNYLRKLT